jgi:hypothetical protein
MVENQRLYASIGYEETGRGTGAGYDPRVDAQAAAHRVDPLRLASLRFAAHSGLRRR